MEQVKYIDSVMFRITPAGNDKLAASIPAEDRAMYQSLMDMGLNAKEHKLDEVVLTLALTPWEYFGSNDNGDALFERPFFHIEQEGTLPVTSGSFTRRAMASRNHQYRTPDMAIGDILYAAYNNKYKRVEVLIVYRWEKAAGECRRISRNKCLLTSMGYRICAADLPPSAGEFCSYCGHHNQVPGDRCDHLATMTGSLIDGVPVFMMNGVGYFVDISSVAIPGDFNSRTIMRADGTEKKEEEKKVD